MNRRNAVLLGALVAALAVAELVVLSGLLAAERRDNRQRYGDAIARQRRAAGRELPTPAEERTRNAPQMFCVRGVATFVAAIQGSLQKDVVDGRGRLDTVVLHELSNLAIRAERYVEQATAGPALPQRMGRVRRADSSGGTEWAALEPPRMECDGGQAFASFRLPIEAPPIRQEPNSTKSSQEPGTASKTKAPKSNKRSERKKQR